MNGSLFLFPVTLGDSPIMQVLPQHNQSTIMKIKHFIVENVRTARRFLKLVDRAFDIDACSFYELNKHTSPAAIASYLAPCLKGEDIGLLSEAGCPCCADPGNVIVEMAHQQGITVVPLVGPSSILLSLMASGFNGQNFAFLGYLPIDDNERARALKRMEQRIYTEHQTQIFIETPYRNHKLIETLTKICPPTMKLCVAANLSCEGESITTLPIKAWKSRSYQYSKTPAIFLLYK